MSPEQTGRINCTVDNRSDLYSFGITLYELLTGGKLPFYANDLPGWILCHLAVKPKPLPEIVPSVLSKIVYRLLNKRREERYSSASSLCSDLKNCLKSLQSKFTDRGESTWIINDFEIGQMDAISRFTVSNKLYGRSDSLHLIDRILVDVSSPHDEYRSNNNHIIFITGESGIGKTSFSSEIEKRTSLFGGTFIFGLLYSSPLPPSSSLSLSSSSSDK